MYVRSMLVMIADSKSYFQDASDGIFATEALKWKF